VSGGNERNVCACNGRGWLPCENTDTGKIEIQACDECTSVNGQSDDVKAGAQFLLWFAQHKEAK
jgi:hypothetical protein